MFTTFVISKIMSIISYILPYLILIASSVWFMRGRMKDKQQIKDLKQENKTMKDVRKIENATSKMSDDDILKHISK